MASLYGDDLDRKSMWERIGNGIVVCSAKCAGDWEAFVNQMLQYIKADGARVASSKGLQTVLEEIIPKTKAWKESWLRCMETRHYLIIVQARAVWNSAKSLPKVFSADEVIAPDGFGDDIPGAPEVVV